MEIVAPPLALVVNVVGADIVPVGGGLGRSPPLIGRLDREVRSRLLRRTAGPLVVPARMALEPALIGAAILGYLVFDSIPDFWTWVGAAVIVCSGLYLGHAERLRYRRIATKI